MGQSMSCGVRPDHQGIFASVQCGDIVTVRRAMSTDPSLLNQTTPYDRHSLLHVAAASGQIEVTFHLLPDLAGISTESGCFGLRFDLFTCCADLVLAVGEIHESRCVESSQADSVDACCHVREDLMRQEACSSRS